MIFSYSHSELGCPLLFFCPPIYFIRWWIISCSVVPGQQKSESSRHWRPQTRRDWGIWQTRFESAVGHVGWQTVFLWRRTNLSKFSCFVLAEGERCCTDFFFYFRSILVGHCIIRRTVTTAFHFKGSNIPAQRYYDRIMPESYRSCVKD